MTDIEDPPAAATLLRKTNRATSAPGKNKSDPMALLLPVVLSVSIIICLGVGLFRQIFFENLWVGILFPVCFSEFYISVLLNGLLGWLSSKCNVNANACNVGDRRREWHISATREGWLCEPLGVLLRHDGAKATTHTPHLGSCCPQQGDLCMKLTSLLSKQF